MEEIIKMDVTAADGTCHTCRLVEKRNNQNGQMLYIFRDEMTSNDFTITRHQAEWLHINGDLPRNSCVQELGDHLDRMEKQ